MLFLWYSIHDSVYTYIPIHPSLLKTTLKINMASLTKRMVGTTPAGSNPGESLSPHCVKSGSIFFFFLFQLFFSLEECQVSLFEGWTEREDRNHQRATSSSSYFPAVSTLLGVSLPPASDWVTSLACLIRSGRPGLPDTATNIPHNRTCFLFYKIWRLTGEMIDQEHRERVGNPNFVVCWFK